MNFTPSNLLPALPELFTAIAICCVLTVDAFAGKRFPKSIYYLVQMVLVVNVVLLLCQYHNPKAILFSGTYIFDQLAVLIKLTIIISAFVAFFYGRACLPKLHISSPDYHVLGLFAVLGMMVMASAHHFITLFLGLELLSLPLYAMIALRKTQSMSTEAALKYFIMGSLASGILLYGLSMLYGVTHSLDIGVMVQANQSSGKNLMLIFGLVFVLVGLAFKLGVVPFHMWVPEIYEGASSPVILFLGTAPKVAVLALIFRLITEGLFNLSADWQSMLIVISVLSMAVGNLAAIVQTNLKRMLAYSSIAHMGYMILGLIAADPAGYAAALFYMMTYMLMTLAAFGLLVIMSYSGYDTGNINDLKGLNSRNPWLALMMLFTLFSLAGVPPIVGFMAKVAVIEALIHVHLIWLASLALLFSVMGAYYYIRVVKVMYFEIPSENTSIHCTSDMRAMLTVNGCVLLALGVIPGFLFTICRNVF